MFQGLAQGSVVSILYRNVPKVVDGRVVSSNTHMPVYNPQQPMAMMNGPVTDLTVQVENDTIPFAGLPASGVVANFPDKGMFLAIDKSAVIRELEAMLSASKQILESVPVHQKMVSDCESLIIELSPDRKKEAQQSKEMSALKDEMAELKRLLLASLSQTKKEEV